ncbi:MAG: DNA mismatch repair protein MutS [bacterium]
MTASSTKKKKSVGITPMMAQFLEIKQQAPDALLFYRMGDFYELFFEDAIIAAKILDITLTRRGQHQGNDIPMCGVPHHSHESYLAKLIRAGHKVAICEQTESPEEAKKRGSKSVVRREIVRLVTPGTLTEDTLLEAHSYNFLAALSIFKSGEGALGWLDMSTGDFSVAEVDSDNVLAVLTSLQPKEIIIQEAVQCTEDWMEAVSQLEEQFYCTKYHASIFKTASAKIKLGAQYSVSSLDGFGNFSRAEISAMGALMAYLELTQLEQVPTLNPPRQNRLHDYMSIDATTRYSLELLQTQKADRKGSLLDAMDKTVTGQGARRLSSWVSRPLLNISEIINRQDAIATFVDNSQLRKTIRAQLKNTPDLDRALSRLALGRGGARDMAAIRETLLKARDIAEIFTDTIMSFGDLSQHPVLLQNTMRDLEATEAGGFSVLINKLRKALSEDLPLSIRDGGFIAAGYDPALDEIRNLKNNSTRIIAKLESDYRETAGIKALKIKHNNVLGYFIDVPAAHGDALLKDDHNGLFIHRQTLANNIRFTTVELSELDTKITHAKDKALAVELEIFEKLRELILSEHNKLKKCATAIAFLDVVAALAELAVAEKLTRPTIDQSNKFDIVNGRHLVVEAALQNDKTNTGSGFIPNSCRLSDQGYTEILLVTGPNMAGKSTFLRQNALIAIMAQMGSFVPASKAHIGVVDRVFSRVGASDDLARGRSTFMVEMVETAAILNQATEKSLVILDEIGRGTATYDGLSIAWASLEHLHNVNKCRGLFATHYHEMTHLAQHLSGVRNVSMKAREWKGDVVFLHEVIEGAADRSYGVAVARLAGLPKKTVARAEKILKLLENGEFSVKTKEASLPLFEQYTDTEEKEEKTHPALSMLEELDPDSLAPREALEVLYALKAAQGKK